MADANEKPFRFMDLPGELRNNVYTILLCSFAEPIVLAGSKMPTDGYISAILDIDATILRTNKQVYREAYAVMVKTNRFIHVIATGSVPFQTLLRSSHVPIVTLNEIHASQFRGYVMRLTLSSDSSLTPEGLAGSRTIMIRARHLYLLCMMIMRADSEISHGGDNANVLQLDLHIEIAPILNEPKRHYEPLLNDFFSDDLVEDLLLPLEIHIREMKVSVHGNIRSDMSEAICHAAAKLEWTSTDMALQYLTVSREIGLEAWKAGDHRRAFHAWNEGSLAALRMRRGNSWPSLLTQGGEDFIDNLAQLHFLLTLNLIQYALKTWSVLLSKAESWSIGMSLIASPILGAEVIIRAGYWKDGHTFRPSDAHLAKFRYRQTRFMRLAAMIGDGGNMGHFIAGALDCISKALQLLPNDPVLVKEQEDLLSWIEHVNA